MARVVFESDMTPGEVKREDSGCAMIWECSDVVDPSDANRDAGMFVRLQSWDDDIKHALFKQFVGHRVRITVEVSDVLDKLAEI